MNIKNQRKLCRQLENIEQAFMTSNDETVLVAQLKDVFRDVVVANTGLFGYLPYAIMARNKYNFLYKYAQPHFTDYERSTIRLIQ